MPATASQIGFIQHEFRRVTATTNEAQTRYGSLARESEDPIETYFDDPDDAQVVCDARQDLLSAERRRFQVSVAGIDEVLALDYLGAVPVGRYRDTLRSADMPALISEIRIDLGANSATLTVWG